MYLHDRGTTRIRRAAVTALVVTVALSVAAGCGGSAVDAKTAAEANSVTGLGYGGQAATNPDGTVDPGTQDGSTNPDGASDPASGPSGQSTSGPGGNSGVPGGPGKSGANPPAGVAPAVSCNGFKNGPGITDDVVRIGNSSDISGPVPGLFTQAQQAVKAYVAYFNASGATICGRKLQLDLYDSKTDNGADQAAYVKGCGADFAMVGSMSAFDAGGASAAQSCGIPDIRAIATTPERGKCTTCFAAQPAGPEAFENAVPDFIKRRTGGKKAAMLYINIGASAVNGESQAKHMAARGVNFVVKSGIDVAEFNYGPYVQQLKSKGADSINFIASPAQFARLGQAMQQAGYKPKLYLLDPSAYSDEYIKMAGSAAKGTVVFLNFTPFEEANRNPEIALYMRWLQQVSPGAKPGFFGLFAWSAARLFAQEATRQGGKLTRASLLTAMKKVDNWTDNGAHSPMHVGSKKIGDCWRFIQWSGSAWVPIDGTAYQCRGLTYN